MKLLDGVVEPEVVIRVGPLDCVVELEVVI